MRAAKGTPSLRTSNSRLQIRFRWQGQRYCVSTGLPDSKVNRKALQSRLAEIERDISYGEVDTTLGKYKPHVEGAPQSGIELLSLWDKYAAFKLPRLAPSTKNTFDRYRSYISRFPSQDPGDAVQIRDWIASTLTPDSGARLLTNLSAACKWGVKSELLEGNPFLGMAGDIRVRKDDDDEFDIRPFRLAEQEAILQGFEQSKYYRRYTAMIRFFLWTGCRPSEGIALKWKHCKGDSLVFEQAIVRVGTRFQLKEGLKTQARRTFPVNDQLGGLLESIKPEEVDLEGWIFPSPEGGFINPHNFRVRAWTKVLEAAGVEYRTLYQTRHTFITNCLERGVPIPTIAKWVGNSPEVLMAHYAGSIREWSVPTF